MANTHHLGTKQHSGKGEANRGQVEHWPEGLAESQKSSPPVWNCQTSSQAPWTLQNHKGIVTSYVLAGASILVDHTSSVPCVPINPIHRNEQTRQKLLLTTT